MIQDQFKFEAGQFDFTFDEKKVSAAYFVDFVDGAYYFKLKVFNYIIKK